MDASWLAAVAPIISLATGVAAQVAWFRAAGRRGLLKSLFAGFAVGLAATVAIWLLARRIGGEHVTIPWLIVALITYAALGYGYFHFVNLGQTARRVRLLWEVHQAGGELAREDLLRRYGAADIVGARLERLLGAGQIVLREGRYVIGRPTMLVITRLMGAWKSMVLGGVARR